MCDERRTPDVYLHDMTWPEVEGRRDQVDVILIPVGSTEQHGPHLRLATDATRAKEFSMRVAREVAPRALVAPVVSVGIAPHHMDFPGTITLRPSTLVDILFDYASSFKSHGFDKMMIINAHGGNHNTLGVAVEKIRSELDLVVPYVNYKVMTTDVTAEVITTGRIEHAGEWEVSDAMFLAPELVKEDALTTGEEKGYPWKYCDLYGQFRVSYPLTWRDITENGAMGDAREASYEKGKQLNNAALDRIVEFLEDFMAPY